MDAPYEIWVQLAQWFQSSEEKMFENVDRWMTDRQTTELLLYYKVS